MWFILLRIYLIYITITFDFYAYTIYTAIRTLNEKWKTICLVCCWRITQNMELVFLEWKICIPLEVVLLYNCNPKFLTRI